jgi:hypothetical protein
MIRVVPLCDSPRNGCDCIGKGINFRRRGPKKGIFEELPSGACYPVLQ